jgi:hypothetical protein
LVYHPILVHDKCHHTGRPVFRRPSYEGEPSFILPP